jgi:seryl-tRNA synthetase
MLDINFIRKNTKKVKQAVRDKGIDLNVDKLLEVDKKRREVIAKIDALRGEQKKISNEARNTQHGTRNKLIEKAKKIKFRLEKLEKEYAKVKSAYDGLMARVPTVPSPNTPVGRGEKDNKEIYVRGKIPRFGFKPKNHIEIGKNLDILDLERGAKVGGYRGYYVKNEGVLLMLGMMNFALRKMMKKGYRPMLPPTLVRGFSLFGSGYFKGMDYDPATDEIYQIASGDKEADGRVSKEKKFLAGTAEPTLLAYYSGEVLKEKDLPLRLCGFSQCYRSEIGSYGKETKGLYRVHEFMKVEQVILAETDVAKTNKLQEEMIKISEELLSELGLPYRKLQICTGDMSPGKYRAFDLETWLPGLERWGETQSASNFLDWQARRLNVKYINSKGEKKFVYMLNNTALATPRTFIAILENYQQADGSVLVPKTLQKYVGKKVILPK